MTKAIHEVYGYSGLQIAELSLHYAPYDGFSVDTLVTAVRGLYNQHGQADPWQQRTEAEWAWVLNRHDCTHYAVVEDIAEITRPGQWLAYTNVSWRGDFGRPHQERDFGNMIHNPTDLGRRAAQAILIVDSGYQFATWANQAVPYKQQIVLDVPDLGPTLAAQRYNLQSFGDRGQQVAGKEEYTHTA